MKLKIAKKAGFCMGVRRAVNIVLKTINEGERPIYTYGPLIHNPQVLKMLEKLGVSIIKKPDEEVPPGKCIIRAHGVPPEEKEILAKKHKIIDGTCPRVLKVHALAERAVKEGKTVIIIGDRDHAEVKGILGVCKNKGIVISSLKEVDSLPPLKNYLILSQTTQDKELFKKISEEILKRFPGGKVINTICNATEIRQNEVRALCKECDMLLVIGGKFSANTNRLAQIAKEEGTTAFLIETPEEIPFPEVEKNKIIGITAGASTPNWLINEIVNALKRKSLFYKIVRNLAFLSFFITLNFLLLFFGNLNFLGYKWKESLVLVFIFLSSFLIFKYNFITLKTRERLKFYYPFKANFLEQKRKRVYFLVYLSYIVALLSGLFYKPLLLVWAGTFLIADFLIINTHYYFLVDPIFLFFLNFLYYPFLNLQNILLDLIIAVIFAIVKFYLEIVYFQTDGFIPANFFITKFLYKEEKIYSFIEKLLFLGMIFTFLLALIDYRYLILTIVWIAGYFLKLFLERRPLGQIILLEGIHLLMSGTFFLLSMIFRELTRY
jgi:4-hydroxy-3-methylbut-2-enyl diphosphate reductase